MGLGYIPMSNKPLELQLSEAQDSYKVMCDRVNELEQDVADMDKENNRLLQENDKLRGLTVKLAREGFDEGYKAGLERAAEQLAEAQAENQRLRNELSDLYVRVPLDEGGNTDTPVQFVGVYVTRWGSALPTDAFVEWEDRQGEG